MPYVCEQERDAERHRPAEEIQRLPNQDFQAPPPTPHPTPPSTSPLLCLRGVVAESEEYLYDTDAFEQYPDIDNDLA